MGESHNFSENINDQTDLQRKKINLKWPHPCSIAAWQITTIYRQAIISGFISSL